MKYIAIVSVITVLIFSGSFNHKDQNAIPEFVQSNPAVGLNLGNQAPELNYSNPEGVQIKLSSLRGKLVLIDFWASWCRPCRGENPAVVAAYNKFKDQKFKNGNGFTVYSVSLDANPDSWKAAISKDGLVWENHVSDLKGWNSGAAAIYDITSIPSNFLINDKGIIIDKNLRGEDLIKVLERLVLK